MDQMEKLSQEDRIHPDALYAAKAVAVLLAPTGGKPLHVDTVYRIPERHLPKTRVGPRRGRTLYRGRDILRYLGFTEGEAA